MSEIHLDPALQDVTITICVLCLAGEGGECHSPGCLFWICPALDAEQAERIRSHGRPTPDDGELDSLAQALGPFEALLFPDEGPDSGTSAVQAACVVLDAIHAGGWREP